MEDEFKDMWKLKMNEVEAKRIKLRIIIKRREKCDTGQWAEKLWWTMKNDWEEESRMSPNWELKKGNGKEIFNNWSEKKTD